VASDDERVKLVFLYDENDDILLKMMMLLNLNHDDVVKDCFIVNDYN